MESNNPIVSHSVLRQRLRYDAGTGIQCESKKSPWGFLTFSPKWLGIFSPNFTHLLYIPIYAGLQIFLSNYLQYWPNYAIFSATTQFTSYVQNVHHRPKRRLAFSTIFPKQLRIFHPNFTHLLHVSIYARLQIFIQLSPNLTKLCHIKCDHSACRVRFNFQPMVDILSI